MLTIFSTPKPFQGHNTTIQINAIRSWLALNPACEIILFGNDEGAEETATRFGVKHIPEIEKNEYGTPLISSMFNIARDIASYRLMCYVNADIILMSDFLSAIRRVRKQQFLIIGRRWDIDIAKPLDFTNPNWEELLKNDLAESGKLHEPSGIDYFVFPRDMNYNIPSFAVGRPGWDNWMIYRARSMKIPVIDATGTITAVHQNHDYSHHPGGTTGVWDGPERARNIELMGGIDRSFTIEYATQILTPQGIKRALTPRRLYFRLAAMPMLYKSLYFLHKPMQALTKLIIFFRSILYRGR